jgi:hypothetical protein
MNRESNALLVKVLAGDTRPTRLGTRLTYMPRNLLTDCSFDAVEQEKRPEHTGS